MKRKQNRLSGRIQSVALERSDTRRTVRSSIPVWSAGNVFSRSTHELLTEKISSLKQNLVSRVRLALKVSVS